MRFDAEEIQEVLQVQPVVVKVKEEYGRTEPIDEELVFQCHECGLDFLLISTFTVHVRNHHSGSIKLQVSLLPINIWDFGYN